MLPTSRARSPARSSRLARSPSRRWRASTRSSADVHALNQVTPDLAYAAADKIDALVAAGEELPRAGGRACGVQGQHEPRRHPDDVLEPYPRELRERLRLHRGRTPGRGGRAAPRQVQHGRVRLRQLGRDERDRAREEPVGPRPHPGWIERGQRGGGRRRPGDGDARLRHRRLDPPAGRDDRHGGAQADLRARQPLRLRRVRELARPDRPVLAHHRGQRARARGDLRQGPDGRHERRAHRRGVRLGGARRRRLGHAHRHRAATCSPWTA